MGWLQKMFRTKPLEGIAVHDSGDLVPAFGLFSLTMLGVGCTVGTGIFFVMAEAVPKAGPAVLLAFMLAGLTAALTALCYAELAASIPTAGACYTYTYVALGEIVAVVVAACLLLEYGLAASATAIGWSGYLNNFLENAFGWPIPPSLRSPMLVAGPNGVEFHAGQFNLPPIVLIVMCALLLLRGAKESATANAVMVVIKLLVLAFFVAVASTAFDASHLTPFFNSSGITGVAAASGTVFFSFIGLDAASTAGAEVRNPKRNVPLGIVLALVIVLIAYLLVALAALGAQRAEMFTHQDAGLAVILQHVTGRTWPAIVLSAGAVISVFSVTLVIIYGQTRILFAISRDGLIPRAFQKISPRTLAPTINTVFVSLAVALVAGTVDSTYLWDMVSMGTLVAFIAVSASVPVLRARHRAAGIAPGFRLPFGPYVIPGLSILSCLYILKDLPHATYVVFFCWLAVALAIYFVHGALASRQAEPTIEAAP